MEENKNSLKTYLLRPSVTDLEKTRPGGLFCPPWWNFDLPDPCWILKSPWSILFLPGEQFSFPGDAC